jgi:hypothetical protein
VVSKSRSNGYRFVDGEISGVVVARHTVDFRLSNRRVTVEKTAATSTLRNGERIRTLLQEPLGDAFFHVLAFQKVGGRIHYTGPTLTLYLTVFGAAVLATGLYAGLTPLLVSATSLFVLDWIMSAQKSEALRLFRLG